ncbi:hypothetical protein MASB_21090 [Mycobacteroides abscessus subsp. bolletii BD]|nr:hypothetical protein MASB_21090 [Mycobacteroides abscessus subsp. bolletii BD]
MQVDRMLEVTRGGGGLRDGFQDVDGGTAGGREADPHITLVLSGTAQRREAIARCRQIGGTPSVVDGEA